MSNVRATVLTRPEPTRDRQNNQVRDWSAAVRQPYDAMLQPLSSVEIMQQSDQVTTDRPCFFPPEAVVSEYDRVEIDGITYEVNGRPGREQGAGPLAVLSHLAVLLREVTG
ncbi:hypothetical protein OG258_19950 [Streptomyces mirabilis]|uniref:hypothetical protein n=1 Tax=Streptomyces mirabilis TaxID=68239 RepID=UPI002E2BE19F|nr:hypothetical protein [Streptomyces mirabilis]